MSSYHRDEVFVAGGQPTVTYVDRQEQEIERMLARAIAAPNQIVSLSGPTKTGKTVLCKKILGDRPHIWIDGGKLKSAEAFWGIALSNLGIPIETTQTQGYQGSVSGSGSIPLVASATGSTSTSYTKTSQVTVDLMSHVLDSMVKGKVVLVIDDFHYIPDDARTDIMRNVKGAVYNGLKIILLSVTHRVFDAIQAESELTGRFTAVILPHWSKLDLQEIPKKGFAALAVETPATLTETLCRESQENPFLMQKFCWEVCFDCQIEKTAGLFCQNRIPPTYDPHDMFIRLAKDAGLPIYQKLAAGPQSRKIRERRPLRVGGEADIYEVMLKAIAETGPKATIKYDELKSMISNLLTDRVPQKHEVTSALKHLAKIARDIGAESAIDWNEHSREITLADPYLRFYLRWQVRSS